MRLSMYDTASREVQEIAPGKDSISSIAVDLLSIEMPT